jgi:hypothetical protein
MIFIFEQSSDDLFKPFPDAEDVTNYGVLVADKNLRVYELTKQCKSVCNLSRSLIEIFRYTYNREPCLEDLFQLEHGGLDFQ